MKTNNFLSPILAGLLLSLPALAAELPELPQKIFGKKVSVVGTCQLGNLTQAVTLDLSRPHHNKTKEGWFPNSGYVVQTTVDLENETFSLRLRDYFGNACYNADTCQTKSLRDGEQIRFEVEDVHAKDSNGKDFGGKLSCNAIVKVDQESTPTLSQLPEDRSFQPIRVTGADAEVIYTLITDHNYAQAGIAGDHVVCVSDRCHISLSEARRTVADSSGFYNNFLSQLGIPEVKNLSIPSLGLASERRFNVHCLTEANPGFGNGIATVKECTLSPSGVGTINKTESEKIISLIHPQAGRVIVDGNETIDTFVFCETMQGDGLVWQKCLYSKNSIFDAKLEMSSPLSSANGIWYDQIDQTQGQFVIQSLTTSHGYSWGNPGSATVVNQSFGRIICDVKKSICQAMKY